MRLPAWYVGPGMERWSPRTATSCGTGRGRALKPMSVLDLREALKDIPGARVGLEFEMIVPNVETGEEEYGENDYDMDERTRSWSNIEDFWLGGEGNNSRRDVRSFIEALQ